jgi:hypothetical protein
MVLHDDASILKCLDAFFKAFGNLVRIAHGERSVEAWEKGFLGVY